MITSHEDSNHVDYGLQVSDDKLEEEAGDAQDA
jgi:hypothetical protein